MTSLTKAQTMIVKFYHDYALIKQIISKRMIGRAKVQAELYVLENGSTEVSTSTHQIHAVTAHHWHQRFGHPSINKLKMLDSSLVSHKDLAKHSCTVCPLAKQKKLSFVCSNNVKPNPFDLVHCDIWGPYSVNTHNGNRYFVTLVDDCSRFTWVYMIRKKSDAQYVIPRFFKMIHTQFGKPIKQFRSDNAKELAFTEFFMLKVHCISFLV